MSKNTGPNIWVNADGETVKSAERPEGDCWFAAFNPRRVSGSSYTPYRGLDEWSYAANEGLKADANHNFRNGKR